MLLWCTLQITFIEYLFQAVCKQHMVRSFSPSFHFPAGVFPCSYVVMSKKHVTDLPSVFLFFTRAMVKMVQWFHLSVVALVGSSQLTLELDWALPALGSGSSLNNDPCNSGFFKFFPSSNLGPNPPTHPRWHPKFTFSTFTPDPNLHKSQIYTGPKFTQTQIYTGPIFTQPRFTQIHFRT